MDWPFTTRGSLIWPVCVPGFITHADKTREAVYRTIQPIDLKHTNGETYRIEENYAWNGASIPRVGWTPLGLTPWHPQLQGPSLGHDFLYDKKLGTRAQADALFLEWMKLTEVDKHRRDAIYVAVRTHGWMFWLDDEDRQQFASAQQDIDPSMLDA